MIACGPAGHIPPTSGERFGHCAKCHLDFMGLAAFDKHRRGPHGARYCVDPATDDATTHTGRPVAHWRQDDKGRWHEGLESDYWKKENA